MTILTSYSEELEYLIVSIDLSVIIYFICLGILINWHWVSCMVVGKIDIFIYCIIGLIQIKKFMVRTAKFDLIEEALWRSFSVAILKIPGAFTSVRYAWISYTQVMLKLLNESLNFIWRIYLIPANLHYLIIIFNSNHNINVKLFI